MDVLVQENCFLVKKLRDENPEQFYTLVRMHLSFVLDLNTDECDGNSEKKSKLKWNLPFTKKQKSGAKIISEGTQLTSNFIAHMQPIIDFLSKEENISQEGIFRRSGRVTRQQELKILLHQGAELNFNDGQFSVHECATVLKNALSELPESVLTDAHYPAYCQIAELCEGKNSADNEKLLRSIQLLILLLPNENRSFFQEIIKLLHLASMHEDKNRMSADNLATLFTPHLLCPRKLSPEALHTNSQVMSRVVAFMIKKGSELFEIPPTVATDVRAYWSKKERKKLSPLKQMNESICDGSAANTVFTFVDRERTAQENEIHNTETALAQLYAYIQCLPESSKKRKLIKQFNKENGYGTPLRACGKKRTKSLNLGGSIKKHLPGFSKTNKRNAKQEVYGDNEISNSDSTCCVEKSSRNEHDNFGTQVDRRNFIDEKRLFFNKEPKAIASSPNSINLKSSICSRDKFHEDLEDSTKSLKEVHACNDCSESSSQKNSLVTSKKRNSTSPSKSMFRKLPHMFDENIISAQEAKRPLTHQVQDWSVSSQNVLVNEKLSLSNSSSGSAHYSSRKKIELSKEKEITLRDSYKITKGAASQVHLPEEFLDLKLDNQFKTPIRKLNTSNFICNSNTESFLSSPNNTNRLPILYGPKNSFLMTTSTPAIGNSCVLTPIVDENNSMSPITKSTKRMPKAMQETMMTPRCRKPVISLSGTDLSILANSNSLEGDGFPISKPKSKNLQGKKLILEDSTEEGNDSLSSTFRNYLFSRNVLTASPVDLSFSSRADDFLSMSEKNTSEENENFNSFTEIVSEGALSESLMFCLDGNNPDSDFEENNVQKKFDDCSCSLSNSSQDLHHVYETAL